MKENKDYQQFAINELTQKKWELLIITIICVSSFVMTIMTVDYTISLLKAFLLAILTAGLIALIMKLFPEKDQAKIDLYADYLKKVDELNEKRQAHKDFCAENGA